MDGITQRMMELLTIEEYTNVSAKALLFYDYFLTLPLEITEIWTTDFTLSKGLFLINRYASLFSQILQCVSIFYPQHSDKAFYQLKTIGFSCNGTSLAANILDLFPALATLSLLKLKIYSIWPRTRCFGVILMLIGLAAVVISYWLPSMSEAARIGPYACIYPESSTGTSYSGSTANFLLILGFDTVTYAFIFVRCVGPLLAMRRQGKLVHCSLYIWLINEGTIDFLALTILNVTIICMNLVHSLPTRLKVILPPFSQVLGTMLVSRGFLDLRRMTRKYESYGVVHALFWTPDRDMKLVRCSTASNSPVPLVSPESVTSDDARPQVNGNVNVRKLHKSCSDSLGGNDN